MAQITLAANQKYHLIPPPYVFFMAKEMACASVMRSRPAFGGLKGWVGGWSCRKKLGSWIGILDRFWIWILGNLGLGWIWDLGWGSWEMERFGSRYNSPDGLDFRQKAARWLMEAKHVP
jgi:hypothetical protein